MSNVYTQLSDMLDDMAGHGVYDVDIINDEMGKFGLAYDANTDTLTFKGKNPTKLGSGTPAQIQRSMEADIKGGILDVVAEDARLVDALALVEAIVRTYGETPSAPFYGRGRNYKFVVEQIRLLEDKEGNDARTDDPTQG